ncbi:unnamed protein product [Ectocarpus sp. 12 AP-2014]
MPSPVSISGINRSAQQSQARATPPSTSHAHAHQAAHSQPGNGIRNVHGRPVHMQAMNQTGFTSSFATPNTAAIANRGRTPISLNSANNILSQKERLAQYASNTMQEVPRLDLNHFPALKHTVKGFSKAHMERVHPARRMDVLEAITDYQSSYGDNFLMNISAMGYQSLQHFLQSQDPKFHSEAKVNEFIEEFADQYGAFSGLASPEEELDELADRLEGRLAEPADLLKNFLNTGPRISNLPLLKGASGGDNPVTTQLDGQKVLTAVLNGQALYFNTFLSTTTDYKTALEFSGKMPETALGNAIYTVDLIQNTEESEVLRRDALRELESNAMNTGSILFYFKTQNATGVDIQAAKQVVDPNPNASHLNDEDEVLLSPGHYFQPEKIVRNEDGVALIGSLTDGNLLPR